ncbi:MAG: hypothetical protein ACFFC7_23440 [Candidatus Hermodarchaeota archaeon]
MSGSARMSLHPENTCLSGPVSETGKNPKWKNITQRGGFEQFIDFYWNLDSFSQTLGRP